jgi:hypothetical protein
MWCGATAKPGHEGASMTHKGGCHCGKIAYEFEGEIGTVLDCNCSLCRRRGGLLGFVPREKLHLTVPEENLSTYTFNTHAIKHHFCAKCGIAPFGEATAPNGVEMASVNLRCIPALDLSVLTVNAFDGLSR